MAAITLAVKTSDDGTLTIPKEAVEELGLHPGDEVEIRLETQNDAPAAAPVDYDQVIAQLFEEADNLVPEPGITVNRSV